MLVTKGAVEAGVSGKFGDRNHLATMFVMTGKTSKLFVEGSYRMRSGRSSVFVAVR